MNKTLIYCGEGANRLGIKSLELCLREEKINDIHLIDKQNLIKDDWLNETTLLIFPGGRDIPYHEHLKGKANENIRKFVSQGGRYLGICAGAYYACRTIEFEKGNELEVTATRELGFFPGTAVGPIYGNGLFSYSTETGARIANLGRYFAYYNGGCTFTNHSFDALAFYDDLPGKPPAVIQCKYGNGKAIISGVHPEYSSNHVHLRKFSKDIMTQLQKFEKERKQLFQDILEILLR